MMVKFKETSIEVFLAFCALVTVFITLGIILILGYESIGFFKEVSIVEFFTGTEWTPLFANKKFGILPLVAGTFLTSFIAILVALPLGLTIAVYLNEYAPPRFTAIVKPLLEILAAIPTVVYGFFALSFITPLLQTFIPNLSGYNAL